MYICICIYMYVCIYMYICMYVYMYTCIFKEEWEVEVGQPEMVVGLRDISI